MILAVGSAGVGKTAALRQYQASVPQTYMATITSASRSPMTMLQAVMRTVGKTEKRFSQSLQSVFEVACDRFREGSLLIVDEAQHLRDDAFDQLRALHDATGVGIALSGNAAVSSRIQGVTRQADFAQLFSRISQIGWYEKPDEGDVNILLNAWEVISAKDREFLMRLAAGPGALRTITQVLEQATLMARQEDEPRNLDHLKHAWSLHARAPARAA